MLNAHPRHERYERIMTPNSHTDDVSVELQCVNRGRRAGVCLASSRGSDKSRKGVPEPARLLWEGDREGNAVSAYVTC